MKVISRYLSYLALWLVLGQTTGAMAESANTLSVQGRAPVASGVTLTGALGGGYPAGNIYL